MILIIYFIYLIFDLILLILFIEKKINTPSYLPDYLRNYLLTQQEIADSDVKTLRLFLDLYIRNILVHLFTLLLMLIMYLII